MTDIELAPLIERLRLMGGKRSDLERRMAEDKSLRQQGHNPPRNDLYMWPTPEQTTEWQAADKLEALSGRISTVDPDVKRRLESVATTLETCGKHGIPISFAQLAHDIRAALAQTQSEG